MANECPLGISARHCKYQETKAKDILSAMQGDLVFLCTLENQKDCPELKEIKDLLDEVLEDEPTTAFCDTCHHRVNNLGNHLKSEDHRRNLRREK